MEYQIFEALNTELRSANANAYLDSKNLDNVATVALFNNQYNREEDEEAYPLPAVFIEFGNAQYTHEGRRMDNTEDTIRIHIEQEAKGTSSSNSQNRQNAIGHLKYLSAINSIVSSVQIDGTGKLYRLARETETDHDGFPVHIIEYIINYTDTEADSYRAFVESSEDVSIGIEKEVKDELNPWDNTSNTKYIIS
jgi:hypothetical protein